MSDKAKNKQKPIDVNYTEVHDSKTKQYYDIEDACKELEVENYKIIYWCNKLNDILGIQSIGMFMIFTENDIRNLKIIRDLDLYKKMSIDDIKKYMNEHKNEIILKKDEEVQLEGSLLTIIAKIFKDQNDKLAILSETQSQILKLNERILENQSELKNELIENSNQNKEELKDFVATTISDTVKENMDSIKNDMQMHIDKIEFEKNQQLIEKEEKMKDELRKQRDEYYKLLEEEKNIGFFAKLFRTKKKKVDDINVVIESHNNALTESQNLIDSANVNNDKS